MGMIAMSRTSKKRKKPNFNQVRQKIRQIAAEHSYSEDILLGFAEYINGGAFKLVKPKLAELKAAVLAEFKCKSYPQLKKNNAAFALYVQDNDLKMTTTAAWLKVYRKFVGLPESERNAIGETSINGVDVLRNFLPWKVFALDPTVATAEDIKSAFNKLALQHHPDHGGNSEVFQKLKLMRDSLLAAYQN